LETDEVHIVEARTEHIPGITDIYNDAVAHTVATFDTSPRSPEEQTAWFQSHGEKLPILVAIRENIPVGWASVNAYSDRCAYAGTGEISLYIRDGYRGRGIGKELTTAVLRAGREAGLHAVVARIESSNEASIHIFKQHGFVHVGVLKEVGCKFDRLLDVVIMQLIYREGENP
jgi:phosphinothricin acetyltransferase